MIAAISKLNGVISLGKHVTDKKRRATLNKLLGTRGNYGEL